VTDADINAHLGGLAVEMAKSCQKTLDSMKAHGCTAEEIAAVRAHNAQCSDEAIATARAWLTAVAAGEHPAEASRRLGTRVRTERTSQDGDLTDMAPLGVA
jgi:hypothetical protein